jgi:DeoR/GlpR family transcriptional regulator of sugar metabolism
MEHFFPGRAQAVAENFLRARSAEGGLMTLPLFKIGLILAPVKLSEAMTKQKVIVGKALKLLKDDASLESGLLARRLKIGVDELEKAINAFGSQVPADFMLVLDGSTPGRTRVTTAPRPTEIHENILTKERKAIAAKCASLIRDDDVVFIDGGAHAFEAYIAIRDLVMRGERRNIKVITNSLRISMYKRDVRLSSNLTVVQTGGIARPDRKTVYGRQTVEDFAKHAAAAIEDGRRAVAIVGITYIRKQGCAVATDLELDAKMELMKLQYVLLLGDHTKCVDHGLGHVFSPFNNWRHDQFIISDMQPSEEFSQQANIRFDVPRISAAIWDEIPSKAPNVEQLFKQR